jgi:hypothetical protein
LEKVLAVNSRIKLEFHIKDNKIYKIYMGGIFQLIAFGAQDLYLTGNPQITFHKEIYKRKRDPLSLEDMCLNSLSEKQKGYMIGHYDSYPFLVEKLLKDERRKHKLMISELNLLSDYIQRNDGCLLYSLLKIGFAGYIDKDTLIKSLKRRKRYKLEQRELLRNNHKSQQLSLQNIIKHDRRQSRLNVEDEEFVLDFFN